MVAALVQASFYIWVIECFSGIRDSLHLAATCGFLSEPRPMPSMACAHYISQHLATPMLRLWPARLGLRATLILGCLATNIVAWPSRLSRTTAERMTNLLLGPEYIHGSL
jgi:hypothetical protein